MAETIANSPPAAENAGSGQEETAGLKSLSAAYSNEAERMRRIAEVFGARRLEASALARCVPALLVVLDWFGAPRALVPALPENPTAFDSKDLANMLAEIGFITQQGRYHSTDELPVGSLLLGKDSCHLYLGRSGGEDWWHDGEGVTADWKPAGSERALVIHRDAAFTPIDAPQPGWFGQLLGKARRELSGIAFVSLFANILALAVSLFTMTVYNTVIPSGTTGSLMTLTIAAFMAVIGGWMLRLGRAGVFNQLAAWIGSNVGDSAMRKSLSLSPEMTGRMGLNSSMTRMRSLSGVRSFFSGANAAAMVDFPFVVVFLFVIALLGGWIVFVPITGLALFIIAAKIFSGLVHARSIRASRASNQLQEAMIAATGRLRVLQGISGQQAWLRRLAELSTQSAKANRDSALIMAMMQSVGHAIGMSTVLATMGIGITLVLSGTMSMGGLIASMMLIWRITTPAQRFFTSSVRIRQARDSANQLDRLMMTPGEMSNPQISSPIEELPPHIVADRLFYRYNPQSEPALNGISFEIEAGERVAVIGPNGSGKTTLLNCLAGILAPQNGRVLLAGRDIRQFDPADYRAWAGYQPQSVRLLPVSVRQFLQLGHLSATDTQMESALERAAGPEWWKHFGAGSASEGLAIRLEPSRDDAGAIRLRNILAFSQAILGNPALLVLDDPLNDQDPLLDGYLKASLDALHGKTSVVMATHRTEFIESADKVVILDRGGLVYFGPINKELPDAPQGEPVKEPKA
jgi:ATP-binding cassette, subfamily C, bacterial LapB